MNTRYEYLKHTSPSLHWFNVWRDDGEIRVFCDWTRANAWLRGEEVPENAADMPRYRPANTVEDDHFIKYGIEMGFHSPDDVISMSKELKGII